MDVISVHTIDFGNLYFMSLVPLIYFGTSRTQSANGLRSLRDYYLVLETNNSQPNIGSLRSSFSIFQAGVSTCRSALFFPLVFAGTVMVDNR